MREDGDEECAAERRLGAIKIDANKDWATDYITKQGKF